MKFCVIFRQYIEEKSKAVIKKVKKVKHKKDKHKKAKHKKKMYDDGNDFEDSMTYSNVYEVNMYDNRPYIDPVIHEVETEGDGDESTYHEFYTLEEQR